MVVQRINMDLSCRFCCSVCCDSKSCLPSGFRSLSTKSDRECITVKSHRVAQELSHEPPVLQSFHADASTRTYTHLDWILCQLSSPDLITGPAGMTLNIWIAVIILHSFRDIKWPPALLKRPETHHSSPTGLLRMNELNSSFISVIHWTKWNTLDYLQAQRLKKKECCRCLRTMSQKTFVNGFSGWRTSHLVLLHVTPLSLSLCQAGGTDRGMSWGYTG